MTMKGLTAAREAIGEFEFNEFCVLREFRINVTPDVGHPIIDVDLRLETDSRQPKAGLWLRFHRVCSLQIRDLTGEAHIPGLDIIDLSNDQLENINWQVRDFEEEVIAFYAEDAEITSASTIAESP